jgi:hypothetical protein
VSLVRDTELAASTSIKVSHLLPCRDPAGLRCPADSCIAGGLWMSVRSAPGGPGACDLRFCRWSHGDLNPEPPPCKGGALPVELWPQKSHGRLRKLGRIKDNGGEPHDLTVNHTSVSDLPLRDGPDSYALQPWKTPVVPASGHLSAHGQVSGS